MKKKTLLLILFAGVIAVIAFVTFKWNEAPATVNGKKGIKITAEDLTNAFEQNEANANASYLNKIIEVSGVIAEVNKNQDGKTVLLLASSDPLSGVQCTMKDSGVFTINQKITIKGFCNGYTMVVLLNDCIPSE